MTEETIIFNGNYRIVFAARGTGEFALVEGRGVDILEAVKNLPRGSVEVGRTSLAPPKYA